MTVVTKTIQVNTKGDTDIIDITQQVANAVSSGDTANGIVTVFIPGATGAITTVEYEPGLVQDLKRFFEKIAPKADTYQHNLRWHDNNGYAHVRASFLGPDISIPIVNKKLQLGTWQQIIFIDFDNRPRSRTLIVQIMGDR